MLRRLAAGGENCARLNLASKSSALSSASSGAGLCGSACLLTVPADVKAQHYSSFGCGSFAQSISWLGHHLLLSIVDSAAGSQRAHKSHLQQEVSCEISLSSAYVSPGRGVHTCFGWHIWAVDAVSVPQEGCGVGCAGSCGRRCSKLRTCRASPVHLYRGWAQHLRVFCLACSESALQECKRNCLLLLQL